MTKVLPAWMKGDSLKCKDFCAPTFYMYISNTQLRRCQGSQWKRKDISEGRSKNLGSAPLPREPRNVPGLHQGTFPTPKAEESGSVFLGVFQHCYRPVTAFCFLFLFFEMRVSFGYTVLLSPLSTERAEDLFLAPRCPDQKQAHIDLT